MENVNNEEALKQKMLQHIKAAINFLEKASNIVECDDNFNEGQSDVLNKIYDVTTKVTEELRDI